MSEKHWLHLAAFMWHTVRSRLWRVKLAELGRLLRTPRMEMFRQVLGPRWAFHLMPLVTGWEVESGDPELRAVDAEDRRRRCGRGPVRIPRVRWYRKPRPLNWLKLKEEWFAANCRSYDALRAWDGEMAWADVRERVAEDRAWIEAHPVEVGNLGSAVAAAEKEGLTRTKSSG